MGQKNSKVSNVFIVAISICATGAFIFSIFEKSSLTSGLFALSFIIIFARYAYDVMVNSKISIWVLLLCALTLISTVDGIGAGFNRTIITVSIIFSFDLMSKETLTKRCKNFLVGCFALVSFILLYLYYFAGYDKTYFGTTNLIDLNIGNPNLAGLWLCTIFILVFVTAFSYKKLFIKMGLIIVSVLLIPIINATGSRNSLASCILCIAIVVLKTILRWKKIPQWCIGLFVWAPLFALILYMYMILPNYDFFENMVSFIEGAGKKIDSRETVWSPILNNIKKWALIGNYREHSEGNLHNSILTVAANYGIAYAMLLFHFLYKSICKCQNKKGLIPTMAVGCVLFTGCFEASVFVGAAGLYLMVLVVPVISSPTYDEVTVNG